MSDLSKRLEELALKKSKPFCYSCYKEVHGSACSLCGSDDNMRLLPGVGCEYGTDWIISHLISENLKEVDVDEVFSSQLREIYGETTKIGWIEVDTVDAIKTIDRVSYKVAFADFCSELEGDESYISFDGGNTYYSVDDVERYLDSEGS